MKHLTLNSEFFKNECAESFCKAILNNKLYDETIFRGFDPEDEITAFVYELNQDLYWDDSITFKLDDSFKVDWACLEFIRGYTFPEDLREQHRLDLDYLSTLEGVEIKEVEE